jgi:hypothetical protein
MTSICTDQASPQESKFIRTFASYRTQLLVAISPPDRMLDQGKKQIPEVHLSLFPMDLF